MKVVILCGGRGTRIRDVSDALPKPMIEVGRYPILWHIMKSYAAFGHTEFVLCTGYKNEVINDFFLNYEARTNDFTITLGSNGGIEHHNTHDEDGWKVSVADTGLDAMTGARVNRIKPFIEDDESFLLTYGDGLCDININELIAFHQNHTKAMTLTAVHPPARFGEVDIDKDGTVMEFNEKPQATAGRISGGFFVCDRRVFDYLNEDESLVLEQEPMRQLAADGEMMAYRHDGFWQCMDTYRDYTLLNNLWDQGKAPWKAWS